jgi:hypothetical protein
VTLTEAMRITYNGAVGIGSQADDFARPWRFVVRKDQPTITQI